MVIRLINGLKPIKNECFEAYLERLRIANYYVTRFWYQIFIPKFYPGNSQYSKKELEIFSVLTGLTLGELLNLTLAAYTSKFDLPRITNEPNHEQEKVGYAEPFRVRKFIDRKNKVCPKCIKQYQTWLLPWRIMMITTCDEHKVFLIDHCSTCGEKIRFMDKSCAKCSTLVEDMVCVPIKSDIDLKYSNFIWELLTNSWSEMSKENKDILDASIGFGEKSISSCFYFLHYFYRMIILFDPNNNFLQKHSGLVGFEAKGSYHHQNSIHDKHLGFVASFSLLMNWPHNFYDFLYRVVSYEEKILSGAIKLESKVFNFHFIDKLKTTLKHCHLDMSWVWSVLTKFILDNYKANEKLTRWAAHLQYLPGNEKIDPIIIHREDAAKKLGIGLKKLIRLSENGDIPSVEYLGISKNERMSFFTEDIEKYLLKSASYISSAEVAEMLGVDMWVFQRLQANGVFAFAEVNESDSKTPSEFDAEKVKEFISSILNLLRPKMPVYNVENDSRFLFGDENGKINLSRYLSSSDVLIAIANNEINAYKVPDKNKLNSIWLYKKDLVSLQRKKYINEHPHVIPKNISLKNTDLHLCSIVEAMNMTGFSHRRLRSFKNTELLTPIVVHENDKEVWFYDEKDLIFFNENVVKPKDAAKIVGFSEVTVSRYANQGILTYVSGKNVDGRNGYLFLKSYLMNWRNERLSSVEVRNEFGVSKKLISKMVEQGKLQPIEEMGILPFWYYREDIEKLFGPSTHKNENN